MHNNSSYNLVETPRKEIEIELPDGRLISGPRGSQVEDYLGLIKEWEGSRIVGVVVDGNLRELTHKLDRDAFVQPLNMSTSDGSKIYRRSLTFLLETVFEQLHPDHFIAIDHSVPSGGYFCKVIGRVPLSREEIKELEKKMGELVKNDLPINKEKVSLRAAIKYFNEKGYKDKLRLLKYRNKPYLILYQLGPHRDYHHGYMVPSTGYLGVFKLIQRGDGFILQYPRRNTPTVLFPMPSYKKLLRIFEQYGAWLQSLDIESAGALNDSISSGSIREVILVSEALHEQKIAQIASKIANRAPKTRIVLIAGPSSSGKTTFSKRLAIQLLTHGISPFALEMDNFFVDREKTPKDERGIFNFEAFDAINKSLLGTCLKSLLEGKKVKLPKYNFKAGKSEPGGEIQLNKNQVIIIEGIHGLNPLLLADLNRENSFRIYVSCLTQLNLDYYNRISTTDTRMLRRIVRDANTRGFSAQRTIEMWESVRRGEREYIFPYQENADEIFNSALVYELAALKPVVEPLLRQIAYGTEGYLEAKRLLAFLEWFLPINNDLIPDNSILREFIGNSILADFHIWKKGTNS
ncbi:MAG: nucleoside kinase [Anaerolineaceae bacterium]|nr:nucleoside kinase [Anaerolineaceae bacterium]